MSASDEIKEQLVSHYSCSYKLVSNKSDWKRTSKKKVGDLIVREFACQKHNVSAKVVSEEDEDYGSIIENDVWLFAICNYEGSPVVSFAPERLWNSNKTIPDQHLAYALKAIYGMPYENELMENVIELEVDREVAIIVLTSLGFVHSTQMENDLTTQHFS